MENLPFLFDPKGKRLIQIHPSFACNLKCSRCYSSSGLSTVDFLSASTILNFLRQAINLGYSYVGISGGEPLLWPELYSFLDEVQSLGYSSAITSNGQIIDTNNAKSLRSKVGVVSISFDGRPEIHDQYRGKDTFYKAQTALDNLANFGIITSIAFTLTRENGSDLRWLYDFAYEHNVQAFEVHPLIDIGRAKNFSQLVPGSIELRATAWLLAICVLEHRNMGPVAVLDAIQKIQLVNSLWFNAWADPENQRFSDLVPSLVVEPDGTIIPFIIGFPHLWAIGSIFSDNLVDLCRNWIQIHKYDIQSIIRSIVVQVERDNIQYLDLFASLLLKAKQTIE
jgi:Fe-coproporphyrin III synthase